MRPPVAYRRGWVAQAPVGVTQAALDAAEEAEKSTAALPSFQHHSDGSWILSLAVPVGLASAADATLDLGPTSLRATFPGGSLVTVDWPPGTGREQIDGCSARFLKRRGELLVVLPAATAAVPPEPLPEAPVAAAPAAAAPELREDRVRKVDEFVRGLSDRPHGGLCFDQSSQRTQQVDVDPEAMDMAAILMLHSAAANGNAELLTRLMDARADPDALDELGATVLEKACIAGSREAARLLLDRGANPRGCLGMPSTPLHRAAVLGGAEGHELVRLLLARRANARALDRQGHTAAEAAHAAKQRALPELLAAA
mmetsp:Transcript_126977/g.395294  ORF Transcript_126977/g.395294 Transcript_126977/m.395294 type:complete len:313 (+) Transcript_126977:42-980(+)